MAENTGKLLMSKTDFTFVAFHESIVKRNTHVEATPAMMRYVETDRAKNGPKLLLFLIQATGTTDDMRNTAFMGMMRDEQRRQDDGAAAYVPPEPKQEDLSGADVPESQVSKNTPETAGEGKTAVDQLRSTLEAMPDKEAVLKYADSVLGMKMDARIGRERAIETILAKMTKAE